jgi:hypothetical protein
MVVGGEGRLLVVLADSRPLASGTRAMMPTPGVDRRRQHALERLAAETR